MEPSTRLAAVGSQLPFAPQSGHSIIVTRSTADVALRESIATRLSKTGICIHVYLDVEYKLVSLADPAPRKNTKLCQGFRVCGVLLFITFCGY